jgi:hypothetical protein
VIGCIRPILGVRIHDPILTHEVPNGDRRISSEGKVIRPEEAIQDSYPRTCTIKPQLMDRRHLEKIEGRPELTVDRIGSERWGVSGRVPKRVERESSSSKGASREAPDRGHIEHSRDPNQLVDTIGTDLQTDGF